MMDVGWRSRPSRPLLYDVVYTTLNSRVVDRVAASDSECSGQARAVSRIVDLEDCGILTSVIAKAEGLHS
jgi:hypothetical protein